MERLYSIRCWILRTEGCFRTAVAPLWLSEEDVFLLLFLFIRISLMYLETEPQSFLAMKESSSCWDHSFLSLLFWGGCFCCVSLPLDFSCERYNDGYKTLN